MPKISMDIFTRLGVGTTLSTPLQREVHLLETVATEASVESLGTQFLYGLIVAYWIVATT